MSNTDKSPEPPGSWLFYSFIVFVLAAPLYKAGNRPMPLLFLELAALGFLFAALVGRNDAAPLSGLLQAALGILLAYPLLQLIPLPEATWTALPGHGSYATVLQPFVPPESYPHWRPISIAPAVTEYGWLAMLPPLACLVIVPRLAVEQVARLLLAMVVLGALEGLLGLLQIGPGSGGILYFGNEEPGQHVAIGTFVNPNHLAAMLAMLLPVTAGLLMYSLRPGRRRRARPFNVVASEDFAKRSLLFASAVLILLGLVFTRSRAGLVTGLIGLACSAAVLSRARAARSGKTSSRSAIYWIVGLVAAGAIVALAIGLGPLINRLGTQQFHASGDFRAAIYASTWDAARAFAPLGSGLSTFASVFPRYQAGDLGGYIDYAHNDYLQAMLELGVAGLIVIVLLLFVYARRMQFVLSLPGGRSFTLLQLSAGLGMLPLILHSVFDFALHMPSNAMWFATLAGVLFHVPVGVKDSFVGQQLKNGRLQRMLPRPKMPVPLGGNASPRTARRASGLEEDRP